jgi:cellulose biosynthesis protein BcsQ
VSAADRVPVLLAITGRPYEEGLLAASARPGSRFRVARRCLDLTDLLAAGSTAAGAVAVVWSGSHRLDRESFVRLSTYGVAAVAVVEPSGAATSDDEVRRMLDLGASATVLAPPAGDPRAAARFLADIAAHVTGVHARTGGDATTKDVPARIGPDPEAAGRSAGRVITVWGPTGAPGRTTVAIGVADELARLGPQVLLADADTYGPSVAQRLGILDEVSGMAAAARAANAGTLDAATLAAAARALPTGLHVLTGLTRADRWPELPAAALTNLWRVARSIGWVTVVDAGFCLEEDDELSFDAVSLRRNAATVTSLAAADAVVVVGSADPVGLTRLLRAMHELADLDERRPGAVPAVRHVVVNRVRPGAVGRRNTGRRIAELLDLDGGVASGPAWLPHRLVLDDPAALDRSMLAGGTLAEVAPRSPARAPLVALAGDLAERLGLG